MDGKKAEALKLLKAASKNMVSTEEEYKDTGEKAPFDTELYLAIAYHQNDSLDKAIGFSMKFRKKLGNTDTYREEYIDHADKRLQIWHGDEEETTDYNLRILLHHGLKIIPVPAIRFFQKMIQYLFLHRNKKVKQEFYAPIKPVHGRRPVDITKQLGGYDRFYSNSITGDGKMLIIYMDDGGDGNLYYCQREGTNGQELRI